MDSGSKRAPRVGLVKFWPEQRDKRIPTVESARPGRRKVCQECEILGSPQERLDFAIVGAPEAEEAQSPKMNHRGRATVIRPLREARDDDGLTLRERPPLILPTYGRVSSCATTGLQGKEVSPPPSKTLTTQGGLYEGGNQDYPLCSRSIVSIPRMSRGFGGVSIGSRIAQCLCRDRDEVRWRSVV